MAIKNLADLVKKHLDENVCYDQLPKQSLIE